MIQFLKSLSPKTRILLAFVLGGIVILLFWITLLGFLSTRHSMEKVNQYDVAIGLARQTDADFQLAISKAKNFAILKDATNRERAQSYFGKAQGTFGQLSQVEEDPEGKRLLYQLGAGLRNVEFSLGILLNTAKKNDPASGLYARYLKDITIDFDNASQAYVDYLDGKIRTTRETIATETQMDLLCALAGALLALGGMGLSYSIAYSLNQALRNETAIQERYRVLSEVAEEAILIHDRGIIVDANPTLAQLLGYPVPELIGQHVARFMDSGSAETTQRRIREGYPESSFEVQARRKDGSTFTLLVRGRDIEYQGRQLRLSCGWDMTEWKKAEQTLQESEERFRRFFEVAKEGILIHERGIIQDVNQTLVEMVGLPASEIIGKDSTSFLTEESVALVQAFRKVGYPTAPYEVTIRRKDGSLLPAEAHGREYSLGGRTLRVVRMWDITERKKAEEALRESDERFKRFSAVTKEGIYIHEGGVLVDANETLAAMLGYSAPELIGQKEIFFRLPERTEQLERFEKEGFPETPYELEVFRKNGTSFPAEVHGRSFWLDGKRMRVVSIWDITDRQKAEEALKQSEDYFRNLIENSHDLIAIVGEDRLIRYISPSVKRILGYLPAERIGQSFAPIIHPGDLEWLREEFKMLLETPATPVTVRFRMQHKNGKWRNFESIGINLLKNPSVRGLVYNMRDITEKVEAEEALRASEERFRNLIESSHDVISITGKDARMNYISPSVKRVLGYEASERIGHSYLEIMHPDDVERIQSEFSKLRGTGGASWTVQFRLKHKDGSWKYVESTGTNLLEDPAVQGIVYNLRDITETKLVEEALRKSEEKFRNMLENSFEAITLVGADGKIIYLSPSNKKMTGYDVEERMGHDLLEIIHPDDLLRAKEFRERLMGSPGLTLKEEIRGRHKNGDWLDLEVTATNLLGHPDVGGILINSRDVTEKKRAEDTLRKSEENFRNLIEKSPDGILVHRDGKIIYLNPKLVALLGYEEEGELMGEPPTFLVHPDDQKIVKQRIQVLSQGGKTTPVEVRLVRRDGAVLPADTASIQIQFEGAPAIMVNLRDITARKQAEEAVRETQERYRSLVESMPDSVMIHDEENILYVNPSAVKTFGANSEEEFIGKPFWMVVPAEFRDAVRNRLRAIMERGAANELAERKLKRLDGTVIDVLVTSVPFNDHGRRVVLAIFLDITPLKEAERRAQRYQRLAALGEMAAGMAHEIRNPTAAISAQAQYLLKKTQEGSPSYEQLKDIVHQCDRLDTLVHDTLDYSPEKKFEERTEVAAKALFHKSLWLAQTQFGPSHQRIQVTVEVPEDMPSLKIHPTRMERVLVNLILNAFQAMPDGGTLLLKANRQENQAVLRVEDNGKGITQEEMRRLFEPFYTSRKMGSGLGLAICQKIVEEHGGQIHAGRAEPNGAVFTIQLPLEKV